MPIFNSSAEIAQVGRFGAVGIFNTLFDFVLFNLLSSRRVGLTKLQANTISTSITMVISFFLNKSAVFHADGESGFQAASFFLITAFGLYVLQNSVIYVLAQRWRWPRQLVNLIRSRLGLRRPSTDFILKNSAKVAGTLISLTWNYIMYKQVVFRI